jgi:hypothetical protein
LSAGGTGVDPRLCLASQTEKKANALVRANQKTVREADPNQHEVGCFAEWRGDRWWVGASDPRWVASRDESGSSGNVIGGGGDYLDAPVPPGGRVGFDVPTDALSASQVASAQVSVEPY